MNRTNYTDFSMCIIVINFRVIVLIIMHYISLFNKSICIFDSFVVHFIISTFNASITTKMIIRSLIKRSMDRAYYFHFLRSLHIIYFTIIISITMNFHCFLYKFLSIRFKQISFIFYSTFWATSTLLMLIWSLFEISVNRTSYNYFCFCIYILNFIITIFTIMYCLNFINPFFSC